MPTIANQSLQVRLDLPMDAAVEKVTAALKEEGFGVLTEINVQATLKQKIDVDFRPYRILGACNPRLAHQALSADLDVGLMLPCNVVVYEDNGGTMVQIADPEAMMGFVEAGKLDAVAAQARERLERVIRNLG
ncbi:MAG: DUF302 domain-containing protein [Herpetosiphon sp.]|nr:DUF302 domain-containing protein [Herpetosiphon sp.]